MSDLDIAAEALEETGRWRSREVSYWAGLWRQLSKLIPEFETRDFKVSNDTPPNPHLKMVVRAPRTLFEMPVPVGVVSKTYRLVQHTEVADVCFKGIRLAGIEPESLRCEVGLTELGEWMNLRIFLPEEFNYVPRDAEVVGLRLECYNSVEGSSRLVILMGWIRFICLNGMIIGETMIEMRDLHNQHLDLKRIPGIICENLIKARRDQDRLKRWEETEARIDQVARWTDSNLTDKWGKKAACRVFHICKSGYDVEIVDPFAPGKATEKPVKKTLRVPGAPDLAHNLYDVSQALAYVATRRTNTEERIVWQRDIPRLIGKIQMSSYAG